MSKRVHLSDLKNDDDNALKTLLENFIRKSEELERRESKVFKQVELVQTAVASLQAWKQGAQPPTPPVPPVPPTPPTPAIPSVSPPIDIQKIERETKEIKEETERIQREVQQKIEANRRLQEELDRRNTLLTGQLVRFATPGSTHREARLRPMAAKEIETRATAAGGHSARTYDPGIEFFNRKLDRLKQLERKVRLDLQQEAEESSRRKKSLTEKMDLLERESKARNR